ncbi:GGDEF domain-containing protein [Bradyrhizobium canariense]|uniref:diguanylate cyclase n=1 Tax=Bradyrhizobium canariense TaxID=255045 RepID=A0A1H1TJC6_9BRAD|nr:GGDEF domain-containing protein [Bradyrhizobium canariense]SDS60066.1 diguanylate cyclase [Bradyrhizobium canariense]
MGTAASAFLNPISAELDGVGPTKPTAEALSRRARQRRQILGMVGVSYVIDAIVLLIYSQAGTIPAAIGPAYAACGLFTVACNIVLSEAGFTERFKDHYFVTPQAIVGMTILLAFTYIAPQVGVMFLCSLFVVFNFSSLCSTPRQMAVVWTTMAFGVAGLFLLTDKPISMPHGSYLERVATMSVFVLTVGRCMFLGMFSNSMRQSLYKSGLKLKEAYRRIEELAELDELTGSYNRRCIMRMLDEEISRARRLKTPCSIALIDLDWFKRINDAYGHPTGDEVLRTFAITMFANIRSIDRFGRYGGEEFLLVLPDTHTEGAVHNLERLREIIADLDWSAFSPGMQVTISAGVTTLKPDETSDTFLARADSALYIAKARGRDRIASA